MNPLTKQYGPLPGWAWVLVGVGAILAWQAYRKGSGGAGGQQSQVGGLSPEAQVGLEGLAQSAFEALGAAGANRVGATGTAGAGGNVGQTPAPAASSSQVPYLYRVPLGMVSASFTGPPATTAPPSQGGGGAFSTGSGKAVLF